MNLDVNEAGEEGGAVDRQVPAQRQEVLMQNLKHNIRNAFTFIVIILGILTLPD